MYAILIVALSVALLSFLINLTSHSGKTFE